MAGASASTIATNGHLTASIIDPDETVRIPLPGEGGPLTGVPCRSAFPHDARLAVPPIAPFSANRDSCVPESGSACGRPTFRVLPSAGNFVSAGL